MLQRAAERVYWTGRYLERVENTARLANAYTTFILDVQRGIPVSWWSLVELNGAEALFQERFKNVDERNVMKFLLADTEYPGSLMNAINCLRENLRTTRDVMHMDAWEYVNELYLFAKANISSGINRKNRHEFLGEIIARCQQVNGLLSGAMMHGTAWVFFRMGQGLERADQTSRLLDAGISLQIASDDEQLQRLRQLIWVHVLRATHGEMAYRKHTGAPVESAPVSKFILGNKHFPRSMAYALRGMRRCCDDLPKSGQVKKCIEDVEKQVKKARSIDPGYALRVQLNELQIQLGNVHSSISGQWFET